MRVPKAVFPIVNLAGEAGRYSTDGVHLQPGPSAVVTDGKCFLFHAWGPDDAPRGEAMIAQSKAWKEKRKASDKAQPDFHIEFSDCDKEARFPKYEQCTPNYKPEECTTICVNPELLGKLLTTMAAILQDDSWEGPWAMLHVPHDPKKAIQIEAGCNEKPGAQLAVLMPTEITEPTFLPQINKLLANRIHPCEPVVRKIKAVKCAS